MRSAYSLLNERSEFNKFFMRLLCDGTGSCFERDVIRKAKEKLWEHWLDRSDHVDNDTDEMTYEKEPEINPDR